MFNSFKKLMKFLPALAFFGIITAGTAKAQLGDAGAILRAGAKDANTLLDSYVSPYAKGFGANLNTGWFNTAKSHKKLGFDVSLNVAAAFVPSADQLFNVEDLTFTQLERISGNPVTPTIAGEDVTNTEMGVYWDDPRTPGSNDVLFSFDLPGGTGFPYTPSPMVQASVGLIKDTDISLRFVPTVEVPGVDADLGLFGVGIKHGLNQWLPGGKLLPVDVSVQFGYTTFNASAGFDVTPDAGADTYNSYPSTTWDGQGIDMETTASTFNAIVGKTLPFISVYAGVGFENSTTTISTPGSYPITSPNPNYDPFSSDPAKNSEKIIEKIDEPVKLEIDGSNSVRGFVGTRIKIAILQISASYTLANYSSFNVGFGIGLR
jgi:hypothetical protein